MTPVDIFHTQQSVLDQLAVKLLATKIHELLTIEGRKQVVLGLPGGRSVKEIYARLVDYPIPWNKVHIFLVDERVVSPEDQESNYRLIKETFFSSLVERGVAYEEHLHRYPVELSDAKAAEQYESELVQLGGGFDLILLSSGEDTHIGALYPEHHSVRTTGKKFTTMLDAVKSPAHRMTATAQLLSTAKMSILLFYGEAKKEAYQKFMKSSRVEECPATVVRNIPESYVLRTIS